MTTQTIHDSRKLRVILDGGPVDAKAVTMMKEKQWQRSLLGELAQTMQDASICGLGQAAPNPMQCVMRYFPHEIWTEHFMTTQTIHDSRKLRFILDGEPVDAKAVTMMKEKQWQRSLLGELAQTMQDASICGLGQAAPNPMQCVMRYFPHEI